MVRVISQERAVVEVAGAIDMGDIAQLRNEVNRLVDGDGRFVVVDLTFANRLGPRGLALLVDEQTWLLRHGCEMRIVKRATARDDELARLFHLYPSIDEALSA
jgi:anti-anti-sigma regulatory factor